jgi:hypothetical protein
VASASDPRPAISHNLRLVPRLRRLVGRRRARRALQDNGSNSAL